MRTSLRRSIAQVLKIARTDGRSLRQRMTGWIDHPARAPAGRYWQVDPGHATVAVSQAEPSTGILQIRGHAHIRASRIPPPGEDSLRGSSGTDAIMRNPIESRHLTRGCQT